MQRGFISPFSRHGPATAGSRRNQRAPPRDRATSRHKNNAEHSEARRLGGELGVLSTPEGMGRPRRRGGESRGALGEHAGPGRGNSFAMLINRRLIKTAL